MSMDDRKGGGKEEKSSRWTVSRLSTKIALFIAVLLFATLGAVMLVQSFGLPFVSYSGEYESKKQDQLEQLNLIADLKKEYLLDLLAERKMDTVVLAKSSSVRKNLASLLRDPSFVKSESEFEENLLATETKILLDKFRLVRDTYEIYSKVWVADARTGRVLISTVKEDRGKEVLSLVDLNRIHESPGAIFIDKTVELKTGDTPRLLVCIEMETDGEPVIAVPMVLGLEIDTLDLVSAMWRMGQGLGETGEALLVNRETRILTPLKHRLPDGSVPELYRYSIQAFPARQAASGKQGLVEIEDYRGIPVLAAYRYLELSEDQGWGMVVKQDRSEVYDLIEVELNLTMLTGGFIFILALLSGFAFAKTITRPITKLRHTVQEVESGNLKVRTHWTGPDELGRLGRAANAMIGRLQAFTAELEAKVKERTRDLVTINKDLEEHIRQRKRVEEELVRSEAKFRGIFESNITAVFFWQSDGRVSDANEAFLQMMGYDRSEVENGELNWKDLTLPEYEEADLKATEEIRIHGVCTPFEKEYLRKDGSRVPILLAAALLDREEYSGVCFTIDQTEQVKALDKQRSTWRLFTYYMDSINAHVYMKDMKGNYTFINKLAESLFGVEREKLAERKFSDSDFFDAETASMIREADRNVIENGEAVKVEEETWRMNPESGERESRYYISLKFPLREEDGTVIGLCGFSYDITKQKEADLKIVRSLKEKEVLLREIHHRVKNNLQVISSMLNMQSRKTANSELKAALQESRDRVNTMALVHERLYRSEDLKRVDFGRYINSITTNLFRAYQVHPGRISLEIDVSEVELSIDKANACGLIVNELISNALKHAFPNGREGAILIRMKPVGALYRLVIQDDGVGLPEGVEEESPDSLGMQLVRTFVEQLNGTLQIRREQGSTFIIHFEA